MASRYPGWPRLTRPRSSIGRCRPRSRPATSGPGSAAAPSACASRRNGWRPCNRSSSTWLPPALHPGAIQGKEGIKFCYLATLDTLRLLLLLLGWWWRSGRPWLCTRSGSCSCLRRRHGRANVGGTMRHSLFLRPWVDVGVQSQVSLLLCLQILRRGRIRTHLRVCHLGQASWSPQHCVFL